MAILLSKQLAFALLQTPQHAILRVQVAQWSGRSEAAWAARALVCGTTSGACAERPLCRAAPAPRPPRCVLRCCSFPTGQTQALLWALCACHQHTLFSRWQVRDKYGRRRLQVTAYLFLRWLRMFCVSFYAKPTAAHLAPFSAPSLTPAAVWQV